MLKLITLCLLATLFLPPAAARQTTATQTDSILALLPRLHGEEKLDALRTLGRLTHDEQIRKRYVNMLLDEARRQKNVTDEGRALSTLAEIYFPQCDTDSVFVFGEEAIRFTRRHKLYNFLFTVHQIIIMRRLAQGQVQTALRKAEEVYEEAKELQDNMAMARTLAIMGNIYDEMEMLDEAIRCYSESTELAANDRQGAMFIFIENYNQLATIAGRQERYEYQMRYADSLTVELERYREDIPTVNMQDYLFIKQYHRAVAYAKLNRPEQSYQAIQNAKTLFEPYWKETFFDALLEEMHITYYFTTGDYNKALEHILRALRFYKDNQLEGNVIQKNMDIAKVHFEMGDHKTAAETYLHVIRTNKELNQKLFYAQINELRTLYELDKAELDAERNRAKIRQQRLVNTGLTGACAAIIIIAALIVWNQRRIARKNIALYRQIKEHDRLSEKLQIAVSQPDAACHQNENSEKNQQQELVARMCALLLCDGYFANPKIEAQELAVKLSTNRTQLYEALKAVTGKGLQEYIKDLKINEAKRLLETSDEPIKNIVDICGFNTVRTFYRQFTDCYNISPAEYRKINRKFIDE